MMYLIDFVINNFFPSLSLRLVLNDGQYTTTAVMFPGPDIRNSLPFAIIKVKHPQCLHSYDRKHLKIITPGDQVGVQLGSPADISSVGKIRVEAMLLALR